MRFENPQGYIFECHSYAPIFKLKLTTRKTQFIRNGRTRKKGKETQQKGLEIRPGPHYQRLHQATRQTWRRQEDLQGHLQRHQDGDQLVRSARAEGRNHVHDPREKEDGNVNGHCVRSEEARKDDLRLLINSLCI